MSSVTAEIYDAIYAFKDYAGEALKIRQLIAWERPGASTPSFCRLISRLTASISSQSLLRLRERRIPAGNFSIADMRAFDLKKRYDVVQCLFSSIG